MSRNSPSPADWALVHDFPPGSPVWQWWGIQGWRRAAVVEHMGPWVKTRLIREDGQPAYPSHSRTYPRHHLLRHRFDGQERPSFSHTARFEMHEVPLDMTKACAVATGGGTIVGWYENETTAANVARDMAAKARSSYFLLLPTRSFSVAEPPVRETTVRRRASR